ncbi:radical SAM protein [Ruegeria arenilitoris]|uniref:radical SAM protein n=1 Tax=Ruegeria arenilitoris TaxID=1173585 RepID=UPI00148135F1|nr:radical SAM protein [Ruegeria arenilitoris]
MEDIQEEHDVFTLIDHSDPAYGKVVLVDWMLGNSCSYACSYCPKSLHDGSIKWQNIDDILSLYHQLQRHYVDERGKVVWLQFTGGEPTMHPRIMDLLRRASEHDFKVSLISNASRTLRFWEKINGCLNNIILTYHSEFAELDHFISVAKMMVDRISVQINVTMHPQSFNETLDAARALRAALPAATISLKPLRQEFGSDLYDYTDDQLRVLSKGLPTTRKPTGETPRSVMRTTTQSGKNETLRANEFILRGVNRWKGYKCNIGLESLRVKGNGIVHRGVCGVGGVLGNLGEEIHLPSEAIRCTRDHCSCLADILTRKEL